MVSRYNNGLYEAQTCLQHTPYLSIFDIYIQRYMFDHVIFEIFNEHKMRGQGSKVRYPLQ